MGETSDTGRVGWGYLVETSLRRLELVAEKENRVMPLLLKLIEGEADIENYLDGRLCWEDEGERKWMPVV